MPYNTVRSEFIKAKIRGSNWNDPFRRRYIDRLIQLEEYVLHGAWGWSHAMYMSHLTRQYKREYDIIFKELKPEEYEQRIREEEQRESKSKGKDEQWLKEFKAKEESMRREWLEAGGHE
jgi:hypothetical protein